MFVSIIVMMLILVLAVYVLFSALSGEKTVEESTQWVTDSVRAWKNDELKSGDFRVQMKDGKVSDVFDDFATERIAA